MFDYMERYPFFCLVLLILLQGTEGLEEKTLNRFEALLGSDSIQVTRCDIICHSRKDKKDCHRDCMKEPFEKSGQCPETSDNLAAFVQACVSFCTEDSDCGSTEKCCLHSCGETWGQTCKPPSGLAEDPNLPPVPYNLTARERKRKNGVQLTWKVTPSDKPDENVMFVLEERHHLGRFFNEPLFGEWTPIHSCKKKSVNLKNLIRPGYWYQFRVAAVNANGTRGFSHESEGFKLTQRPKLPKPSRLRVGQVKEKNGTVWGLVQWNPSESSIPVQRYKIFWSHRLDDRDVPYKSEAVFVQKDSVPESQSSYQLKHLRKNTDYFVQVQAVALHGRNSIKSKMAKMIFKTSKMEDQFEMDDND